MFFNIGKKSVSEKDYCITHKELTLKAMRCIENIQKYIEIISNKDELDCEGKKCADNKYSLMKADAEDGKYSEIIKILENESTIKVNISKDVKSLEKIYPEIPQAALELCMEYDSVFKEIKGASSVGELDPLSSHMQSRPNGYELKLMHTKRLQCPTL